MNRNVNGEGGSQNKNGDPGSVSQHVSWLVYHRVTHNGPSVRGNRTAPREKNRQRSEALSTHGNRKWHWRATDYTETWKSRPARWRKASPHRKDVLIMTLHERYLLWSEDVAKESENWRFRVTGVAWHFCVCHFTWTDDRKQNRGNTNFFFKLRINPTISNKGLLY